MKRFRLFLAGMSLGVCAGALGVFLWLRPSESGEGGVVVTRISGEEISHSDFDFSGDSVSFVTHAQGEGKAVTEIPKALIPEADSWMRRVNSINFSVGYLYGDRKGAYFGAEYLRRFGSFSVGGGLDWHRGSLGFKVVSGFCF